MRRTPSWILSRCIRIITPATSDERRATSRNVERRATNRRTTTSRTKETTRDERRTDERRTVERRKRRAMSDEQQKTDDTVTVDALMAPSEPADDAQDSDAS